MSEQTEKHTNKKSTPFFSFIRGVAWVVFHTVAPIKYYHKERLENLEGPAIIIANHNSLFDPVVIAACVKKQEVRYLGKNELAKNPIAKIFFNGLHMIPVGRGQTDMAAMRSCVRVLKEGEILGIFPEGTRHKQGLMEEMESGTGLIALRSGVPMIPVYFTRKFKLFRTNHVIIGEPIDYSDLKQQSTSNDTCAALMQRITECYKLMSSDYSSNKIK